MSRVLTREMVMQRAREDFESNPAIAGAGITLAGWIRSCLMNAGLDPTPGMMGMSAAVPPQARPSTPRDREFEAEFDAHPGVYAEMGLSKDQYIRSRRIDEGLEVHSFRPGAAVPTAQTQTRPSTPRDREFEAEFDAHPGVYAEMGLSKDQYVRSRQRDVAGGRFDYPAAPVATGSPFGPAGK